MHVDPQVPICFESEISLRLPPYKDTRMSLAAPDDLREYCLDLARRAKQAATELAVVTGGQKQQWLRRSARLLGERSVALARQTGSIWPPLG